MDHYKVNSTFDYESISSTLIKTYFSSVWDLATPKTISYIWGFGRFLGIVIVIQVASGLFLAFYYVRGALAWDSVIEISREVNHGWLLRLVHRNTASFVFVVLFIHFFRGLIQGSFYIKGPWIRGWVIILLTMAAAFLGYVLPWGQISFWGATVIINLISILPIGKTLVIWLWGGFYVSFFTCRFFYAFHFLVPFIVLITALVHLLLLHFRGRRNIRGLRNSSLLKVKFGFLYLYKDLVNIIILWSFWLLALTWPDWSADPVNFSPSDLSSSPIHIQPEWYFLHLYAVLRSIPNKVGGLIGFVLAILVIRTLRLVTSLQSEVHLKVFNIFRWRFLRLNLILIWLGSQAVEAPYISIGQIAARAYFVMIIVIIFTDWVVKTVLY